VSSLSGVIDKDDAAVVPLLLIHPLDGRAVDLFVAVQGGEKLLNRLGKPLKAASQAREPAAYIIVEMRLGNMPKSIRAAAAHRTKAEEASISEEEPQVSQLGRSYRHNAAPSDMTGTDGRICPESQIANTGRNAVSTDDKIVSSAGSIAEADRNTIMTLLQRGDRQAQPTRQRSHSDQQGLLQHGALYSDERPNAVPKILQIDLAKQFTMLIAKAPAMQNHSAIRNGAFQFECTQSAHPVGLNGHAGTEGLPRRIALYERDLEALPVQRCGQSQPCNAASDDQRPSAVQHG
jgi:hypothetical protein